MRFSSRATLTAPWVVLGVYRRVGELRPLISLLKYSGFDLHNLSVLFLSQHPDEESDPQRDRLYSSLLVDGARSIGGEDDEALAAGPLAELILGGSNGSGTGQSVVQALDQTLTAWGMGAGRVPVYGSSVASGGCLVALHVASEEIAQALDLIRRSSADHVTLVGPVGLEPEPQQHAENKRRQQE